MPALLTYDGVVWIVLADTAQQEVFHFAIHLGHKINAAFVIDVVPLAISFSQ